VATPERPLSLLVDQKLVEFPPSSVSTTGSIQWAPPQPNWNCWRAANIDEQPLAQMSLDEISAELSVRERSNRVLERLVRVRQQLPVTQVRQQVFKYFRKLINKMEKNNVWLRLNR
jgi:hypothetical protein